MRIDTSAAPADFADDTALAVAAVRSAADLVTASDLPRGRLKDDGDWVTDVDLECEEEIRRRLAPSGYPVLGEEFGGELSPSSPTWVVDPVDGTWNFATGSPLVAVLVARVPPGQTTADLAVLSLPKLGREFVAWSGHGAFAGTRRLQIHPTPLVTVCVNPHLAATTPMWARPRILGSAGVELSLVASNVHSAVHYGGVVRLWDVAAGSLLVTEAGGLTVTDARAPSGDATRFAAGLPLLVRDLYPQPLTG